MSSLSAWDVTANVITVITGSAAVLLGLGCLWPSARPPRRRSGRFPDHSHRPDRCSLRPIQWPAEWLCTAPLSPFTIAQAHRCMQLHRDHDCPRKHAAFTTLVAAGRITPDSTRSRSIHRLRNDSPPMEHDDSDRFDALARRAAQLGYTLTQNWPNSHYWHLLDPLDNKPLHTAATLDDIETWLAT